MFKLQFKFIFLLYKRRAIKQQRVPSSPSLHDRNRNTMSSEVIKRVNNYLSNKLGQLEGLDLTAHTLTNITRSYYDHQIKGMEKIPSNKAAILVYYHGVIPVDYVALVSRLYIRDGRLVNSIVHRREI